MKIKIPFTGRSIVIGKGISTGAARSDDLYAFTAQRFGLDYKSRNQLDAYRNIVYACISLIGEQCGGYKAKITRQKGDQKEDIGDHPLLELLRNPSGKDSDSSFSQFDLFEGLASYQSLTGIGYLYVELGAASSKPRSLTLLRPDKVGISLDKEGNVDGYFIRQSSGQSIPISVDEMLVFPLFNPKDPFKGYGPVEAGSDYIETDEVTAQFTKNFMGNNAGLSGVLTIKGLVERGAFKKFTRLWRQKYEGANNAGKVAIIRDSEAAFQKVGLGLDELNMSELRKMTIDDVLMIFRVPLPLLGKAEQTGLGRANIEALEYIFAKYKIDPMFKRFDAVMQLALRRYYGEQALTVEHENIIPEDKEFELNERDKGVDRWLKRNEIRDEEGLDSVDGGDKLFVSGMNIAIDEDAALPAAGSTTTDTTEDPPPEPPADDSAEAGLTIKIVRSVVKKKEYSTTQKETFRLAIQRYQRLYERRYRLAVKPIMADQRIEALTNLEAHGSSLTKASQKPFNDANYDQRMVDELQPTLLALTEQQGALALTFAGDEEAEFNMTQQISNALKTGTRKMATGFNDETIDKLNASLAEGIVDGESLSKLKKRVNTIYDDIDSVRSLRIARTETLKASNNATEEAYKQTGFVTGKEWYINPGACDICEEFAAQAGVISLGESFARLGDTVEYGEDQSYAIDYDDIDNPPLHPNCRCAILPVR